MRLKLTKVKVYLRQIQGGNYPYLEKEVKNLNFFLAVGVNQ